MAVLERAVIIEKLCELGKTEAEVAETLRALNITGYTNDPCTCPLANWAYTTFPELNSDVKDVHIGTVFIFKDIKIDLMDEDVPPDCAAFQFPTAFDCGCHNQLLAEDAVPGNYLDYDDSDDLDDLDDIVDDDSDFDDYLGGGGFTTFDDDLENVTEEPGDDCAHA